MPYCKYTHPVLRCDSVGISFAVMFLSEKISTKTADVMTTVTTLGIGAKKSTYRCDATSELLLRVISYLASIMARAALRLVFLAF